MNRNNFWAQSLLFLFGLFFTFAGIAYGLKRPAIDQFHLWQEGPLSKIWYGSVFLGIGPLLIWMALAREWGIVPGLGFGIIFMLLGVSATVFLTWQQTQVPRQLTVSIATLVLALLSAWLALWTWKFPIRDQRITPLPLRIATVIILIPIATFAVLLLRRHPTVFPWPLKPESSTVMGFMFSGAIISFAVAFARPYWLYFRTLFIWFILYDLVLIPWFIPHFRNVLPAHQLSLNVYFSVLIISLLVSGYYFFIHPTTRRWSVIDNPDR